MNKKTALITGITGQDGSYLAHFLVSRGYNVVGLVRHASTDNLNRLYSAFEVSNRSELPINLVVGDVIDPMTFSLLGEMYKFDEIYNLAAQSHVGVSFSSPNYTTQVNYLGTMNALSLAKSQNCRFYQASTSELYGSAPWPQSETTPFEPRSPYAVSKLCAFWLTKNFREAYGVFASNGILFNHESPRRGEGFVTKKICRGLTKIFKGVGTTLELGNLNSHRDWGHAVDYVRAMHMMMQYDAPLDLVIATGVRTSIRKFAELTAQKLGFDIFWEGSGISEKGIAVVKDNAGGIIQNGQIIISVNEKYFRPTEVEDLCGDASLAKSILGWEPELNLDYLINEMVNRELGEFNDIGK